MPGKESQRHGDQAENLFERLALPQFEVTKPQKDSDGWDFMLRLRTSSNVSGLDAFLGRPPPFRYWVQVKSVLAKQGASLPKRVSVNLDRVISAVKDTGPWFFFFVRHAQEWEPCDMFIFHIDKSWIGKVAKRRFSKPDADPTKATIDFTLASGKQVVDAQGIFDYITLVCDSDPGIYAIKKSRWLKHAGLESTHSEVSFRMGTRDEGIDAASDFLLGLRTVQGAELRETEIRFGRKFTKLLSSSAWVKGHPKAYPLLTVSSMRPGGAITMQSKFYTNSGIGRRFAFRVESEALDIVLHPDDSKGTVRLTHVIAGEVVKIGRLSTCARVLFLLKGAAESGELITVHIGAVPGLYKTAKMFQLGIDAMPSLPDWIAYVYMRGHELFRLARSHGVHDDFHCDVVDVYENGPAIAMALLLSGLEKSTASLEFHSDSAPATSLVAIPIAVVFSIAGFNCYATGYFCGTWMGTIKSSEWFILAEPEIRLLRSDFGIQDLVTDQRLLAAIASMEVEVEKLDNVTVFICDSYICRTFKTASDEPNKRGSDGCPDT